MKKLTSILFFLLITFQFCISQNRSIDSINLDVKAYQTNSEKLSFNYHQLILPTSLIITGIITNGSSPQSLKNKIVAERNMHWPNFHTSMDDYLQYTPIAFAYGLDAFGAKSYTDIQNRTVIFIKGELCMVAITQLLKRSTSIQRPDYSGFNSFPSGHTAQAFAAATFLNEEYKHKYKWFPYASYSIASSVGLLRMANNKHYISDVLVGAGIGILSMKLSYWTHMYKWGKNKKSLGKD